MALQEGPQGPSGPLPEKQYTVLERTPAVPVGVLAGGALLAAGIWGIKRLRA
jgi:hypothetical protein